MFISNLHLTLTHTNLKLYIMGTLTEHKAEYSNDYAFVISNIEKIESHGHAEACRNLIAAFHKKYGRVAHEKANYLYGFCAGVTYVRLETMKAFPQADKNGSYF